MDLTTLTLGELAAVRVEILTEIERRATLAAIPDQVGALAARYVAAGGPQATLDAAILPAPTD